MNKKIPELLVRVGFNILEADVHVQLLSQPTSTVCTICRQINRPVVSVQKATGSLPLIVMASWIFQNSGISRAAFVDRFARTSHPNFI
ncbi:MAG: hypothetical protein WCK34_13175 [Bacteroidota bacterium]